MFKQEVNESEVIRLNTLLVMVIQYQQYSCSFVKPGDIISFLRHCVLCGKDHFSITSSISQAFLVFLFCHISWYWSVWMLEFNLRGSKLWWLPGEGVVSQRVSFYEIQIWWKFACRDSYIMWMHWHQVCTFVVIHFYEIKLWRNFVLSPILQIDLKSLCETVLKARKMCYACKVKIQMSTIIKTEI